MTSGKATVQTPDVLAEPRAERPETLAEARDVMRETSGALLFRGGGTKLDWGADPEPVDTVVVTSGLDRLLEHNADDSTAVVEAGMPLYRLQEELAVEGQWLAIDPPDPDGAATVGGVLAANDSGPRRHRYGAMRDLVIGTTVVLADGAVGRSGGKVIKNVAGYDLAKLLCGSLGTLGLVTEVVIRLHPLSQASLTVRGEADAVRATALALDLLASPVTATAVGWCEGAMMVRLEGHPAAVRTQADAVAALASEHHVDVQWLEGDEEAAAWGGLHDETAGAIGDTVVRAGTLPSQLPEAARGVEEAADAGGAPATLSSHVGLGLHTARIRGADATAHAAVVEQWRQRLRDLGGHAHVRRRLAGVTEHVDAWGPPPSSIEVMRRVKDELDPQRRCAPGRLVGGI